MSELLAGSKNLYHLKINVIFVDVSHFVKDIEDK